MAPFRIQFRVAAPDSSTWLAHAGPQVSGLDLDLSSK